MGDKSKLPDKAMKQIGPPVDELVKNTVAPKNTTATKGKYAGKVSKTLSHDPPQLTKVAAGNNSSTGKQSKLHKSKASQPLNPFMVGPKETLNAKTKHKTENSKGDSISKTVNENKSKSKSKKPNSFDYSNAIPPPPPLPMLKTKLAIEKAILKPNYERQKKSKSITKKSAPVSLTPPNGVQLKAREKKAQKIVETSNPTKAKETKAKSYKPKSVPAPLHSPPSKQKIVVAKETGKDGEGQFTLDSTVASKIIHRPKEKFVDLDGKTINSFTIATFVDHKYIPTESYSKSCYSSTSMTSLYENDEFEYNMSIKASEKALFSEVSFSPKDKPFHGLRKLVKCPYKQVQESKNDLTKSINPIKSSEMSDQSVKLQSSMTVLKVPDTVAQPFENVNVQTSEEKVSRKNSTSDLQSHNKDLDECDNPTDQADNDELKCKVKLSHEHRANSLGNCVDTTSITHPIGSLFDGNPHVYILGIIFIVGLCICAKFILG